MAKNKKSVNLVSKQSNTAKNTKLIIQLNQQVKLTPS